MVGNVQLKSILKFYHCKSNLCDSFRGRTISGSFDPYLTAFGIFGSFIKCDRYKFNSIYYFAAYPKRIAQSI